MHKSINYLIVFLLFLISNATYSQNEIKYKDVYSYVLGKDTILAYEVLKEYQEQNPFHANTYYQLGLISQYWADKYDALTQARDVNYFIYHTNVYLNLSKKYIDDKEVRKNREYYQGINPSDGKKISFEDVTKEIDQRIEKNSSTNNNVSKIQNNYSKSVNYYNKCVELFLEINKNNSNYKELLLTVDDSLLNKINKLGVLYDSTIFNLNKFEKKIREFPIKSYNQTHKIRPIDTYRLEGLTYSSFLQKEIKIWNFREWVDIFNKTLNGDIKEIRHKIDSTENVLISLIKKYEDNYNFSETINQTKVKPEILFKIGKYDYNSVIVDLFNYQEATLNFLEYAQSTKNDIKNNKDLNLKKKSSYYSNLVEKKIYADSLKKEVKKKINERSVEKYRDFVNSNFTNVTGLKKYTIKQGINNTNNLDKYLNNLKYFMYKSFDENQKDTVLKYSKYYIPLTVGNDTLSENIKTKSLSSDGNGNLYIAGSVVSSTSEKSFVALMNNDKIKWFKIFSNKTNSSENKIIVKANENGCFAVFSSIGDEGVSNKIIHLDLKGYKKIEKYLEYNSVVRYLNYDDINEKVLLAFYGNTVQENSISNSELELLRFSITGKNIEPDWTEPVKIKFMGSFVDIVTINQNYYVFANYNEYTDLEDKLIKVKGKTSVTQNNTLLVIVNEKGQKINMKSYNSSNYYYSTKVVKINNNLINLMGIYGNTDKALVDINKKEGKFFYMLIDNKGEVLYK